MRQEERTESGLIGVKETLQQDRGPDGGRDALSHVLQPQILPESGSAPAPAYSLGGWGTGRVAMASPQLPPPTGGQQQGWDKPRTKTQQSNGETSRPVGMGSVSSRIHADHTARPPGA